VKSFKITSKIPKMAKSNAKVLITWIIS